MHSWTKATCLHRTPFIPYDSRSQAKDSINSFLDNIQTMGLNTIWPMTPFFDSPQNPLEAKINPGFTHDNNKYLSHVMEPLIEEAHKRNIDVGGWVFTGNSDAVNNDERLLQRYKNGGTNTLICYANPEARQMSLEKVVRLAKNFDLDYLMHEDCLQYFHGATCYCDYCKAHAPIGNDVDPEWIAWKGEQITTLLRDLRRELDKIKPEMKTAQCNDSVLGHWIPDKQWSEEGLINIIAPMTYVTSFVEFERHFGGKGVTGSRDAAMKKIEEATGAPLADAFLGWFEEKITTVKEWYPKSSVIAGVEITGWPGSDFSDWRSPKELYEQTVAKAKELNCDGFYFFIYLPDDWRRFTVK